MFNFLNILKKELKELITPQFIIFTVVMPIVLFAFIGNLANSAQNSSKELKIAYFDMDKSSASAQIESFLSSLKNVGTEENQFTVRLTKVTDGSDINSAIDQAKKDKLAVLLVVPQGFGSSFTGQEIAHLKLYSIFESFEVKDFISSSQITALMQMLNNLMAAQNVARVAPSLNTQTILNPITLDSYLVTKGNITEGTSIELQTLVQTQNMLVPIALMMVIIYCGTMMVSSIALEKENKTLETLLTLPVRRGTIVTAKMVAAAIVGLLIAIAYIVGFGLMIPTMTASTGATTTLTLGALGLNLDVVDYLIMGILLFLSIFFSLATSLLLGVFSEDVKNAQVVVAPVMILAILPYYLFLFQDLGSMTPIVKILMLLDPFTYPMIAYQDLMFGNMQYPLIGIAYILILAAVIIFFLVKIFNTDKILTAKFSFPKFKKR